MSFASVSCLLTLLVPAAGVHAKTWSTPSLSDVEQIATDAEALGRVYQAAASKGPSPSEQRKAVATANIELLGSMDADLASEMEESSGSGDTCGACARDFGSLCPAGWQDVGGACRAPTTYTGPCSVVAYTGAMDAQSKAEFQRRCSACWPCAAPVSLIAKAEKGDVTPIVNIIAEAPRTVPQQGAVGFLGTKKVAEGSAPRDAARPTASGSGLATGSEPVGLYQRKTQSPLVWLNLLKRSLPGSEAMPYEVEAAQYQGKLEKEIHDLQRR